MGRRGRLVIQSHLSVLKIYVFKLGRQVVGYKLITPWGLDIFYTLLILEQTFYPCPTAKKVRMCSLFPSGT